MSAALLDPASEVVVNAAPLRRQYDVVHDKPKNVTVNGGEPLSQNSKICAFCASVILDKYLLKICDNFCHETCLLCSFCGQSLAGMPSCFVKEGKIFCKDDYRRYSNC
uniref:LIM zinc-binding domain-containing protein n=1 Tax=Romanomermis culicivorax TaxID=13658 RepID=A0A915K899_ROMCU